jgi:hypothetical protein
MRISVKTNGFTQDSCEALPNSTVGLDIVSRAPYYHTFKGVVKDASCLADAAVENTCWKRTALLSGVQIAVGSLAANLEDVHTVTTTTSATGEFSISVPVTVYSVGLEATVNVSKAGFYRRSEQSKIYTKEETNLGIIYMYPLQQASSSVSGQVVDTQQNLPLSNSFVQLMHLTTRQIIKSVTTGDDGTFTFANVAPATYKLIGNKTGYVSNTFKPVEYNNQGVLIYLSPKMHQVNDLRLVMGWGTAPPAAYDMDLHVEFLVTWDGPAKGRKCSVTWDRTICGDVKYDIDNVRGGQYGTETITLHSVLGFILPTVYTVYVNNYQSIAPTEISGTKVELLSNEGNVFTIHTPPPDTPDLFANPPQDTPFSGKYRPETKYLRMMCIDTRNGKVSARSALEYSSHPPALLDNCDFSDQAAWE